MSVVRIEFPAPHGATQERIMTFFEQSDATELWVSCGSKFGKSVSAAVALGLVAPRNQGAIYRWVAPIYSQAMIGMRYMRSLLPPSPFVETIPSRKELVFDGVDSVIQFWHGQNPESLEGEATWGNVLDECAKMKPEVYSSAKTTTTVTRGKILCISTPRGKNWFYQKCMEAKAEMEWAVLNNVTPSKLFVTAPSYLNPFVTKEAIAEARRTLPDRLYRQYIEAEFVDEGNVFTGTKNCIKHNEDAHNINKNLAVQKWAIRTDNRVIVGCDWAKTVDYTVFIAIDCVTRDVVGFYRFNNVDYRRCVRELVMFCKQFEVEMVVHDKTGIGQVIHDLLDQTGLPFTGFTFTNESKTNIINRLILGIQSKDLTIPPWETLIEELDLFEVQATQVGSLRYTAPQGSHDDCVMALALAYSLASEGSDMRVSTSESIRDTMTPDWLLGDEF